MGHVATSHEHDGRRSASPAADARRRPGARRPPAFSRRPPGPTRRSSAQRPARRGHPAQHAGRRRDRPPLPRPGHRRATTSTRSPTSGWSRPSQGFDPTHGSDFLSFAVPTIRGEIRRYFRDFGWTIRPPRSVQELQTKITAAEGELFQALGRSPRPSEIAEHLDVDLELVLDSLAANGCFAPDVARHARRRGRERSRRPARRPRPGVRQRRGAGRARACMRGLTPRERRILEMRFFGGCTQAEIGAEVGVTQMQVSRLLSRLLDPAAQAAGGGARRAA